MCKCTSSVRCSGGGDKGEGVCVLAKVRVSCVCQLCSGTIVVTKSLYRTTPLSGSTAAVSISSISS